MENAETETYQIQNNYFRHHMQPFIFTLVYSNCLIISFDRILKL